MTIPGDTGKSCYAIDPDENMTYGFVCSKNDTLMIGCVADEGVGITSEKLFEKIVSTMRIDYSLLNEETTETDETAQSDDAHEETQRVEEYAYEITDVVNDIYTPQYSGTTHFHIIVEVTNTGSKPLYLESCVADYEDDDGHLLQTYNYFSSTPSVIESGEKGYFYMSGGSKFNEDVSFENGCNLVTKPIVKKATGTRIRYAVEDTSIYPSYGTVGVRGRIVNDTDNDVSLIYVTAVFYNADGKVLGISGTNVTDILKNDKTSFDITSIGMKEFPIESVAEYEVYADEMYFQFD